MMDNYTIERIEAARGRGVSWQGCAAQYNVNEITLRQFFGPKPEPVAVERLVRNFETEIGRPLLVAGSLPWRTLVLLSAVSKVSAREMVKVLLVDRNRIYSAVERLVNLDVAERFYEGKLMSCRITDQGRQALQDMRG